MELLAKSPERDPEGHSNIGGPTTSGSASVSKTAESDVASTSGEEVKDQSRTKHAVTEGGGVAVTEGGGVTRKAGRTRHQDTLYYGMGAGNFMLLH